MDLNKRYYINIVGPLKNTASCFIIVEKFNKDATTYFSNYYKHLLLFENEECEDWFNKLDYARTDLGRAVVAKINNNNKWVRGIVSKSNHKSCSPELYLIDSQRFTEQSDRLEIRVCPQKFLQLSLPTFCIDLCFDDENVKNTLDQLITQNQCGKISFCFTPSNIQGDVYQGKFEIYEENNNSYTPLKKIIKHFEAKSRFNDVDEVKTNTFKKFFNPLKFKHLNSIFLPKSPLTEIFENNWISSLMDLQSLDSFEYSSQSSSLSESSSKESIYSNHVSNVAANNRTFDKIPSHKQNSNSSLTPQKETLGNNSSPNSSISDFSRCSLHSLLRKNSKTHRDKLKNFDANKLENVSLEKSLLDVTLSDSSESILKSQNALATKNITMNDPETYWSDSSDSSDYL